MSLTLYDVQSWRIVWGKNKFTVLFNLAINIIYVVKGSFSYDFLIKMKIFQKIEWVNEWVSEVAQSCLTLCDRVDCSLPGSSVHGILQAKILEWVAISFSRGSSWPRDRTQVSCIAGRRFNLWATREV